MKTDEGLLPNFLIIGAAKAGTTTLYATLKKHPQIFFPFKKEMHYFNNDIFYSRGPGWYIDTYYRGAGEYPARGDATPAYLYWGEKVIPRLKETYGGRPPRMIAILRDPVERAYSFYWHNRRSTKEPLSFEAALEVETERLEKNHLDLQMRGKPTWAYFNGGLYGEQLQRYFDHFPRELFRVILLDDLKKDFGGTVRGLFEFLGADPGLDVEPAVSNPALTLRRTPVQRLLRSRPGIGASVKKVMPVRLLHYFRKTMRHVLYEKFSYDPMQPQTDRMLRERYLSDIRHLETLLGRDLSIWRPKP